MRKNFYLPIIIVFMILSINSAYSYSGEYWIKVQNKKDGEISISKNQGNSWHTEGHVLVPIENQITEPNEPGFTAADYGWDSAVVATAVNAIHIRISKPKEHARIFSLLPVECLNLDENYKSYHGSAIITDINGEDSIFGSEYAPYIGNLVYLSKNDTLEKLPSDYVPHIDDEVIIKVIPPGIQKPIKYIRIENKINGYVMIVYDDLSVTFAARVLKPVAGIGGFTGSSLVDSNKIRANHPGVLEISTSKHFGNLGPDLTPKDGGQSAFQIVPFEHTLEYPCDANKFEGFFGYSRTSPVYLILMAPSCVFIEKERYGSTEKDKIIAAREKIEKERGENPEINAKSWEIISDSFEIKDRDYSSVFGKVFNFDKKQVLYAHGFFFGGFFKAATCDASIRKTGEKEFSPIPEYNTGKDLTVFKDVEEIKLYYVGY